MALRLKVIYILCLLQLNVAGQLPKKRDILKKFDFWHNKDWIWYENNIPFFESPDQEIDLTYYYRWEMMTAHFVYGSPNSGYASTEFIDRPWWSGTFGTISCPVGHQLYEFRWLRDKKYLQDYSRYWFKTTGAQLRNYTNWIADAIWQGYKVSLDTSFVTDLRDDLVRNYAGWEQEHWVEQEGLFAWDGMHDGMETNINSRQTKNWFSGAPGYRPTLNSYMWADANAIRNISMLLQDTATAAVFQRKADVIKLNFQKKCWDIGRNFFFHRFQKDEDNGIKANSLTYETGKFAGINAGREEIGFIPWYFRLPDQGYESAWQFLMDSSYFFAPYGPRTVELNDPLFNIAKNCCAWSGNAWPFATSQTLKAMANVLKYYPQNYINKNDYYRQLRIFAITHRKEAVPYIAEANHPETGSWSGHDNKGHSEHYFHSAFIDEVITGLVGLEPLEKDSIEINPLIPDEWEYFMLDNIRYHGQDIAIIWDRDGRKYNMGKGLLILANGETLASSPKITKLTAAIKFKNTPTTERLVNYAVNNDKDQFFPYAYASFPGIGDNICMKANDGQYWYYTSTTNRWSTQMSSERNHWFAINFGGDRIIQEIALYLAEDTDMEAPTDIRLQYLELGNWLDIPFQKRGFDKMETNRSNTISFPPITTTQVRVVFKSRKNKAVGISELEAWGPSGNQEISSSIPVSTNIVSKENAKATASFTSRFDKIENINDGNFEKGSRWTAYESPNTSDWVQFELNEPAIVTEARIYLYDDQKGVQLPSSYEIEYWDKFGWKKIKKIKKTPLRPIAGVNICNFKAVKTDKLRIVLNHAGNKVYSGIIEAEYFK
jgi:hypothetical protein